MFPAIPTRRGIRFVFVRFDISILSVEVDVSCYKVCIVLYFTWGSRMQLLLCFAILQMALALALSLAP